MTIEKDVFLRYYRRGESIQVNAIIVGEVEQYECSLVEASGRFRSQVSGQESGDAGFRFVNRRSRPAAEKKRRKHAGIISACKQTYT